MPGRLNVDSQRISVTVPGWMQDYIRDARLSPSRLLQDAVLLHKEYQSNLMKNVVDTSIEKLEMAVADRLQELGERITKLEK
jgi:hypothetical protein